MFVREFWDVFGIPRYIGEKLPEILKKAEDLVPDLPGIPNPLEGILDMIIKFLTYILLFVAVGAGIYYLGKFILRKVSEKANAKKEEPAAEKPATPDKKPSAMTL